MKGDDGLEFVEFAEGPTKTRPGGLNAKPRQFQPRMFQTGGERCPVVSTSAVGLPISGRVVHFISR